VLVIERHHPIIEDLGGGDRRLAIIKRSRPSSECRFGL